MSQAMLDHATKATNIREDFPDMDLSSMTDLDVWQYTGLRYEAILKYDFSALVPSNSKIISGTLGMIAFRGVLGRTIACYRLRRTDWVWGEATWNSYKAGSGWSAAGALSDSLDYDSTDVATSASVATKEYQEWDITQQAQYAVDHTNGVLHFLLRDITGSDNGNIMKYYRDDPYWGPNVVLQYEEKPVIHSFPWCGRINLTHKI